MDTMLCAVLYGVRDIRVERFAAPNIQPDEVLVRVTRVGVCGSDVHYFTEGRVGNFVVDSPLVLGHEAAGVVVDIGSQVERLQPGERVAIEPGYPCRKCFYCKAGRYNLCPNVTFMATPPVDGAFCEYVAWPQDFVYPLPESMTDEEGAMMEPLSVGLWAVERGGVRPGDTVAVFGSGPIGLLTLQAARAAGATTLIAVDVEDYRLEHARRLGATHTFNDRQGTALREIRQLVGPLRDLPERYCGVDVAFETAGSLITTRNAVAAVRAGGAAVLVGLPPQPMVEIDLVSAASREVDIRGMFRYANRYPPAVALTEAGRVDVASLVTHHFPLTEVEEALTFADEHKGEALKVMVDVAP